MHLVILDLSSDLRSNDICETYLRRIRSRSRRTGKEQEEEQEQEYEQEQEQEQEQEPEQGYLNTEEERYRHCDHDQ